ncbi:MAG: hypothetical protein DWQ34_11185 [Planctomycetota bacterium]|nr:MAG: hypothetical protein DWQ34_11185 [Planctomycetota bacterium]REK29718.1 MAG: hypothetical protein DWQ41_03515 [Planctomycetota bacterium]REK30461.1 MAG: hypothetical protein DWQ45_21520 [Planctomycetota bacterium]
MARRVVDSLLSVLKKHLSPRDYNRFVNRFDEKGLRIINSAKGSHDAARAVEHLVNTLLDSNPNRETLKKITPEFMEVLNARRRNVTSTAKDEPCRTERQSE